MLSYVQFRQEAQTVDDRNFILKNFKYSDNGYLDFKSSRCNKTVNSEADITLVNHAIIIIINSCE